MALEGGQLALEDDKDNKCRRQGTTLAVSGSRPPPPPPGAGAATVGGISSSSSSSSREPSRAVEQAMPDQFFIGDDVQRKRKILRVAVGAAKVIATKMAERRTFQLFQGTGRALEPRKKGSRLGVRKDLALKAPTLKTPAVVT